MLHAPPPYTPPRATRRRSSFASPRSPAPPPPPPAPSASTSALPPMPARAHAFSDSDSADDDDDDEGTATEREGARELLVRRARTSIVEPVRLPVDRGRRVC
jgi:hypothetical protein